MSRTAPDRGEDGLRRELGLFDSVMINAGTMIASGIYIVPATIALAFGTSGPSLLVWVIGGLVSLCGALCVAELGAAMPRAGGQYVFLSRAYAPLAGFLYGWSAFLVINTASVAAIAVGFATYLGFFVPLGPVGLKAVAVASILALTALNCRGLREGALTQNIFTTAKLAGLAGLVAAGFALGAGDWAPVWPDGLAGQAGPFGLAMVAVLWTYDGWIELTYVGSEVRQPGRTLPLGILLATALVTVLYVAINAAYLHVLGPARVAASPLVASETMATVLGSVGATVVTVLILVSTLGANNGIVFTAARIPFAMAREGLFFRWAARVHPRWHTPVPALLAQGAIATTFALTGTYAQLATYVVFVSVLFYALSAAGVIILRHREPDLPRPYRAWGYPVTPVAFIAFALWLVVDAIRQTPWESLVGAGIVLAGVPAYLYWSGRSGQSWRSGQEGP